MDRTEVRDMVDARDLHVAMDAIVTALDELRAGRLRLDRARDPGTLGTISTALYQMTCRLAPRLQGALGALIRAHYAAGGSHGELAAAMEVERSTAQARGDRVRRSRPTHWERWAAGELDPQTRPVSDVRPGWTLIVGDQHVQVSQVVVYDTGHVEISCGHVVHHHDHADEITAVPREVPTAVTTGVERIGDTSHEVTIYRRA